MRGRLTAVALGLVGQFVSIAAGVYLGIQADDWTEQRAHREAARASLENFEQEMLANRERVPPRHAYHESILESMLDSMPISQSRGDPPPRTVAEGMRRVGWKGLQPGTYGHVAWAPALATQSLSDLPPRLALSIAFVYNFQSGIEALRVSRSPG